MSRGEKRGREGGLKKDEGGYSCSILYARNARVVAIRHTLVPVGVLQALWVGVGAVAAGLAVDQHLRHRLYAYPTTKQTQ